MNEWLEDRWQSLRPWLRYPVASFYETRLGQWWCERHGHDDVIWYSGGMSPDMHCKRCGKDCG